jgi:hypothetical protein
MDKGGVDAAVIHPPDWDDSTELAFRAVRDYPGRFAVMGSLPLDQPSSRARIAGWRQQPGMLGLRYSFLNDPAKLDTQMAVVTPATTQVDTPQKRRIVLSEGFANPP